MSVRNSTPPARTATAMRRAVLLGAGAMMLLGAVRAEAQVGWTVGGTGDVFKTSTWGEHWAPPPQPIPTSAAVREVYVQDWQTAYVAGGAVIWKTVDGGASWSDKYTGSSFWNSIFFVDPTRGWVAGATGAIARSTDSGNTWQAQTSNTTADLQSVYFIDSTKGWAAGGGVILRTTNGGVPGTGTWTNTYNGGGAMNSVFFISSSTGWAVGNGGRVTKSVDGGSTWQTDTFLPTSAALYSVFFISSSTGWIAGGGVIFKTTNGGTTWNQKSYPGGATLKSIYFIDATFGWAVGTLGTVLRTADGGETWSEVVDHPSTSATLESVMLVFAPTMQVVVQTVPAGRSFQVDGTTYSAAQTFDWVPGSSHELGTTSPQAGGAGTQYVWDRWNNGGPITQTVSPTVSTTYTASFGTQYYLNMSVSGTGSVSPSDGWRDAGNAVTITANPQCGAEFLGWTGTGTGSYTGLANPVVITMNGPISERGAFTTIPGPPSVVYVDGGNTGIENGTCAHPYNTVLEGVNAVQSGGTVFIAARSYNELLTLPPLATPNKAMTIQALGGTVVIGQ